MANLLVLILDNPEKLSDLLSAWNRAGVPGMTILDGVGARRLEEHTYRDDMPLIPSLRSLLVNERNNNQIVFSVIEDEATLQRAIQAAEQVIGDFFKPHSGVMFVIPVTRTWGIHLPARPANR
ncbi:MAG: P-II family nitrogen regulator [Chloroflexi bacterium]|nr:P-II family nitrogen regulator [Chloroflexota bacterium]